MHPDDRLTTTFTDETGRERSVRITLPVYADFAGAHNLRMEQFVPILMNDAQLLDLCYRATRNTAYAKAGQESYAEFLDAITGPSLASAKEATANAILNFILLCGSRTMKTRMREEIDMRLAGASEEEIVEAVLAGRFGPGDMSADSAEPSESTPETPVSTSGNSSG